MSNILLVEDDDQLRTMLKTLLTISGYEVWDAPNGKGVSDLYREHDFDLVVTDLVMPEVEGLGMITELRRLDPDVRIIAMSGGGQAGKQSRAEEYLLVAERLGAHLTLTKPFDNEEFLDAVGLALGT